MHSLLTALFAMLFSFCHHSTFASSPEADFASGNGRPSPVLSFPGRGELTRGSALASYAGSECLSCGTMNVSFTVR